MRRPTLRCSVTTLTWMLMLGCGPDGGVVADGSASGATDEGETGITSSDTDRDPPNPTTGTTTTSADGSSADGSSADGSSDTGTQPPDADDGEWCGTTSTGALALGPIESYVDFGPSNGGPSAFAGWVTAGELRVAIYDVASASWGEPVTLHEGYVPSSFGQGPRGAVDAEGNAIVAYEVQDPPHHIATQHYDRASDAWTRIDVPTIPLDTRVSSLAMTPAGHAVLVAQEGVTVPWAWFFDPVDDTWSTEPVIAGHDNPLAWVLEPETGNATFAIREESGPLLVRHLSARSGALATTHLEPGGWVKQIASIGNGELVLVTYTGGYQEDGDVYAFHFDGSAWRAPELIGSGEFLGPLRLVGAADGRAVASWNDPDWGVHARAFDRESGWGPALTANPATPMEIDYFGDHRVALDDDGFFIVWSTFGGGSGIRTIARRQDGTDWSAPVDLDPAQPTEATRVVSSTSLGTDRARAIWDRVEDFAQGPQEHAYACHTPISGWSAPTTIPGRLLRAEARPGGDVLVMTMDDTGVGHVEYFTAD